MISTPTGDYTLKKLRAIALGVVGRNRGLWFDQQDVLNDLIVFLLEGKTLPEAQSLIGKKYRLDVQVVDIDNLSDKYLGDHSHDPENVRIMTPLDKKKIEVEFHTRMGKLDKIGYDIMVFKTLGYSDKTIAKKAKLSCANVRVRLHRAIAQLKGMKTDG